MRSNRLADLLLQYRKILNVSLKTLSSTILSGSAFNYNGGFIVFRKNIYSFGSRAIGIFVMR